jgi:hypothetical protein
VDAAEFLAENPDVRARPPMPPAFPPPPPPDMLAPLSDLDPEGQQGQAYQNHGGFYPLPPTSYDNPAMSQQQQMQRGADARDLDSISQETGDVTGKGSGSGDVIQYSFFDARQNALLVPQSSKVKAGQGHVSRAASFSTSLSRHQHSHHQQQQYQQQYQQDLAAHRDLAAVVAAAMSTEAGRRGADGGSYSYGQLANYY